MLTLPLSRKHTLRIVHIAGRLDALIAELGALPDRHAPLSRDFAGRFRRALNEGRVLLGLSPATHLGRTRKGVEYFVEAASVFALLKQLNVMRVKANPRSRRRTYARSPAPW